MRGPTARWVGARLVFGLVVLGVCGGSHCDDVGGVGDPCIPNDEYSPAYGGASEKGAQVEDKSFQCESRVCLVKNFRGRITCPFGNAKGGSTYDQGTAKCMIPGTEEVVRAAVPPQCSSRLDQVYCSCRCAGADANAHYCACPDGFACRDVTTSLDVGLARPGDKYCVRETDSVVGSGYECAGVGCDQADDGCGFSSNEPDPG